MKTALFILSAFLLAGMLVFGCTQPQQQGAQQEQQSQPNVINVETGQPSGATEPEGGTTPPAEETPSQEDGGTASGEGDSGTGEAAGTGGDGGGESPVSGLSSKEIHYRTTDSWEIYGTLYYAQESRPTTVVIMLPMLGEDRGSFDPLVPVIHEDLPYADILVIDMRGHGKSTNIDTWDNFISGDFITMYTDISGAKSYLGVNRPSIKYYYLVGASMGSSAAIKYAAENSDVAKVVMLSPGLSYEGVAISRANEDYIHELYLATSYGDEYSRNSADTLYDNSPSDVKELKIYYEAGTAHGTDLFAATANTDAPLLEKIAEWLRD